ncbi:MAG: hypothetical protein HOK41_11220 [Nitrospina sp.]|jgi:hypothetical protein|nr:hypothetical protein [Nitrospina sp.]
MISERIIFLREDRYSKFAHDRFGIDVLEKRGFSVEYWDCSSIFRPELQADQQDSDLDGFSGLRYFEEEGFLFDNIAGLTSRDILMAAKFFEIKTWNVLRHIASTKALWGTMRLSNLPIPPEESSIQTQLDKFIRKPSMAANFLLRRLPLVQLGLRPLDFILLGGAAPLSGGIAHLRGANTKILDTHSYDYDQHLQGLGDTEEVIGPENVVFLDNGGPFHRDNYIVEETLGASFPCSAEEYFAYWNSFFRLVEREFGCSVVVAAHPRVNYEERGNPFEGRKVVQGKTQKLVKNSSFVLCSCSTAVNFAVIYKKPVVFLTLTPSKRNFFDIQTKHLAAKLGKSSFYWTGNGDMDWNRELKIDQECYAQHMETYIKKQGLPEKPCWEVLADYLTSQTC